MRTISSRVIPWRAFADDVQRGEIVDTHRRMDVGDPSRSRIQGKAEESGRTHLKGLLWKLLNS